ncbi:DUF7373 family lipoprotein [Nakamurella lactea]|uniref:DUF7373 family lipoprotein n=1 Tax=Nakamurella lactea TaxID=459515 RepID=UPI0004080AD7|nr:hypothetical protein [Nakamurella lactea]
MTVRRTLSWRAAIAVIAGAALIAGCANSVAGSAQAAPDATGLTSAPTGSAGPTPTPTTDQSSPPATPTSPVTTAGPPPDTAGSTPATAGSSDPSSSASSTGGGEDPLYPMAPRALNKNPTSEESAAAIEGRRLAGYVVHPTAVMPTYTVGKSPTYPYKSADALSLLFTEPVPAVAGRDGMYAGFSSVRGTEDNSAALVVAVLEFPDRAKAAKAATDMAAAAKDDGDAKLTIPGFPKAVGWTAKSTRGQYAHAFQAIGPLVMYAWIEGKATDKAQQPSYLAKYFSMEKAALKDFKATPKDKLKTLLVDPDGLYARTLPMPSGKGDVSNGAYTAAAMMHLMGDYAQDGKAFKDAGVDSVASNRSTVYRATDNSGATLVRDTFYQEIRTQNPKMQDLALQGTPDAKCLEDALNASYYCTGAVGRYAFEFRSDSATDVTKSLASQIAMLNA